MPPLPSSRLPEAKAFEHTAIQHNLAVLSEYMRQARVAAVFLHLDGYGDNGVVEDVRYAPEGGDPEVLVEGMFDAGGIGYVGPPYRSTAPMAFRQAAEKLALDLFDRAFEGWEVDSGSLGRITVESDGRATAYWLDRQDEIAFEGVETVALFRPYLEMTTAPERHGEPGL